MNQPRFPTAPVGPPPGKTLCRDAYGPFYATITEHTLSIPVDQKNPEVALELARREIAKGGSLISIIVRRQP